MVGILVDYRLPTVSEEPSPHQFRSTNTPKALAARLHGNVKFEDISIKDPETSMEKYLQFQDI